MLRPARIAWGVVAGVVLFFGWMGVGRAQTNSVPLALQMEELRVVLEQLRTENASLKALLAARAVTVEVPGALAAAKVVAVNPSLGAVVLDVGAQQGVRIGMPFGVWRGDRQVAVLRAVEVRPCVSGAVVENFEREVTLRAGDEVRVSSGR